MVMALTPHWAQVMRGSEDRARGLRGDEAGVRFEPGQGLSRLGRVLHKNALVLAAHDGADVTPDVTAGFISKAADNLPLFSYT